ncbi:hypothetical protein [Rhizobium sp. WYJ-E13]|uniref:hypothetical protein n=1 Tax=Rhizobium sp. WYJ-E13 TaxID=2849093 RepID=UPI001C1EE58A|nr:hypothetical protein [Rhizobium sp. WYJ-E13]QWW72576.1 hypothetical protein KQ933_32225 [Rhizobium sp. WYJ-E13]
MKKEVIEYAGEPVGIVVPNDNRLRFIAVKFHVHDLDNQHFGSCDEVRSAIHRLMLFGPGAQTSSFAIETSPDGPPVD